MLSDLGLDLGEGAVADEVAAGAGEVPFDLGLDLGEGAVAEEVAAGDGEVPQLSDLGLDLGEGAVVEVEEVAAGADLADLFFLSCWLHLGLKERWVKLMMVMQLMPVRCRLWTLCGTAGCDVWATMLDKTQIRQGLIQTPMAWTLR